ncbi:glycosyltransferase family 2 protein [Shewanella scandinavica]|uniref:glycosyltransferase family 2 protein n=1 Tax=Shewanella scandinavica TaxID=3063538 RepID=UPI0031979156
MSFKLAVLTATYNRKKELMRLYTSLIKQSDLSFTWLIIDDGSTDGTSELINNLMSEGLLDIQYKHKTNQGKHSALNVGFKQSNSDWLFIVDSDDWLDNDCIESVKFFLERIHSSDEYASMTMLQKNEEGYLVGGHVNESHNNFIEMIDGGVKGDKCDVFRTNIVRHFSFPVFPKERFMSELPLYLWLGQNYKAMFVNYCGYNCKYLSDGLSHNSVRLRTDNNLSTLYVYKCLYDTSNKFKIKLKASINWWRFYLSLRESRNFDWYPSILTMPLGALLYLYDKVKNV